ncbi:ORF241 [White spot syndrome virus]|uniref:ORF241 n=1 Tax=White spot syndrome virus TaxID=342409 RepID=A0A2D3I6A5_9VIRU|nr:ORF241 [White spot syndrome virus]
MYIVLIRERYLPILPSFHHVVVLKQARRKLHQGHFFQLFRVFMDVLLPLPRRDKRPYNILNAMNCILSQFSVCHP